jgi:hypothetical protein
METTPVQSVKRKDTLLLHWYIITLMASHDGNGRKVANDMHYEWAGFCITMFGMMTKEDHAVAVVSLIPVFVMPSSHMRRNSV